MATGNSPAYTHVATLVDLYEKTNTTLKTGIKLVTEEAKWFRSYPKENIKISGNENRIPLLLTQPTGVAAISDGGNEAVLTSPAPTHGTFMPIQLNKRYGYTGLAQALDNRARGAMIEEQTAFQAGQACYAFGRAIGLQTYGQSAGTIAVVAATNVAGTTQILQLKNGFGSTVVPGTTNVAQQTYISNLIRVNENVALIRAGALIEFGNVTASPSASSGVGFVDVTFNSSITPTLGDNIVFANAVTDATITGTDTNNWTVGFLEALLASSVHGVATSSFAAWAAGYNSSTVQRFSSTVKEAMINGVWNSSGVQMNAIILSQGVKRDTIAGERGARRYDSEEVDLEGKLTGFKYLTSQLAPPGIAIGWYDQAYRKVELSDQPEDGGGKSIFKLDKVQDRSAMAASYDYFYAKIVSSRGAMAIASNLTEQ